MEYYPIVKGLFLSRTGRDKVSTPVFPHTCELFGSQNGPFNGHYAQSSGIQLLEHIEKQANYLGIEFAFPSRQIILAKDINKDNPQA